MRLTICHRLRIFFRFLTQAVIKFPTFYHWTVQKFDHPCEKLRLLAHNTFIVYDVVCVLLGSAAGQDHVNNQFLSKAFKVPEALGRKENQTRSILLRYVFLCYISNHLESVISPSFSICNFRIIC